MESEYFTITRYSDDGFAPQEQTHHLTEHVEFLLMRKWKEWTEKSDEDSLVTRLEKERQDLNPDFHTGIWVFVQFQEDKYLLNHLEEERIRNLSCWEAEIPAHAVVYKHEQPYLLSSISTAGEERKEGAFFIPEESLHLLRNIKETKNELYEDWEETEGYEERIIDY